MGLFGRGKSGGLMNVIRCDEQEYLVWKWRPEGQEANSTSRENAIRWGSSLRVKDGECAAFVYKQNGGGQDFIYGPYDETLKTQNFPVLASLVGLGFGGESPFQAEVYFINLQSNNQVHFAVPYFDVFDPRFLDFGVPVAVRGTINFCVKDPAAFVKVNRLINFTLKDFNRQIQSGVTKYVKNVVTNMPEKAGLPVLRIEQKISDINEAVQEELIKRLSRDFGVEMVELDINAIEVDKESEGYRALKQITIDQTKQTVQAQTSANVKNISDMQSINAENMQETLRVQREEAQRAQRLQTETNFMGAHALDRQADVMQTAATSLGTMGQGMGDGCGGGMNPGAMMAGMAMGTAIGGQMASMMTGMGQQMQGAGNQIVPPPMPQSMPVYSVAEGGIIKGQFPLSTLEQMIQQGQISRDSYVWTQGMAGWERAGSVQALSQFFGTTPPPPPIG